MNNGNFVKFSVLIFLLAGIILLSLDPRMLPQFYSPRAMGALSIIYAFFIILPALIYRLHEGMDKPSLEKKKLALINLQTAVAVSVYFDGAGGLGLYELHKVGIPYDKIAHFTVTAILIIALANFVTEWYAINITKAVVVSALVVMAGGILWEVSEYSSDFLFGTKRFGIRGEDVLSDTTLDLVMDALGIAGASFLVIKKHNNK